MLREKIHFIFLFILSVLHQLWLMDVMCLFVLGTGGRLFILFVTIFETFTPPRAFLLGKITFIYLKAYHNKTFNYAEILSLHLIFPTAMFYLGWKIALDGGSRADRTFNHTFDCTNLAFPTRCFLWLEEGFLDYP